MTSPGPGGANVRPQQLRQRDSLDALDPPTAALVRLSARITGGSEAMVREGLAECAGVSVPPVWVEELILQSYLFAGFPRALNAAREWRRSLGHEGERPGNGGPAEGDRPLAGRRSDETYASIYDWRVRGEEMCAVVYGEMYEKLRANIRRLHPQLDEWMIVEGYGKVLSREGLDLPRRELCIVAACVAAQQDRQLHSHLHGARNAGVSIAAMDATLDALRGVVPGAAADGAALLWQRVKGK
jgi:4-carboxymuconolactone decarboxylase